MREPEHYDRVESLLQRLNPAEPVYCIYPHVYRQAASHFVADFPGRVLYAVKACAEPAVIKILIEAGVSSFDCASLTEIEIVKSVDASVECYFMVPVLMRGEARKAQELYGVRHFLIDHVSAIDRLASEIDLSRTVLFARMAVHHKTAMQDLSVRFGAPVSEMPDLLQAIAVSGAEPALAFNVGSMVTSPDAYRHSISVAAKLLNELPFEIRLIDIGGGFPRSYPRFEVPPLQAYMAGIREATARLRMAAGGEILTEPGRALAAPGMSAISEVLLRKDDRLYINDGMHGIFWELRYKGHDTFACQSYRDGKRLEGQLKPFTLFGPTCDSADQLPGKVDLPEEIQPGDHLEFGGLGAYSLSGRTDFNGRHSEHIVMIDAPDAFPPGHVDRDV
jgi:ornithine decarboxylase